ncbi:GmrSD restriction endonuclease domain-containing protein [Sphingobacterium siyangense]|uniref:GmrSD restriction endonuclease domain-containing protein n=1 Tax=Sphingobacterium siyangense TaxID=459529 RepID=UPI003DA57AAB
MRGSTSPEWGQHPRNMQNCLGNLCLVSRRANAKLNDREPIGKAGDQRFSSSNLSPKRKIMYNITNKNKHWGEQDIYEHHLEMMKLIDNRVSILS